MWRSSRTYLLLVLLLLLLFITAFLYAPRTDIPARSKDYLNDLLVNTGLSKSKHTNIEYGTGVESFNFDKYFFQADLESYDLPAFDIDKLKHYPPLHYRGPGNPTFATFYASRNSSMHDPYFYAAQQIVYRLIWDPRSRTLRHPVTVFVAPFISQEQRDHFLAAGAIVKELPLRLFVPDTMGIPGRLADMFTKLEMWSETDYSLISYLDSDAFPVKNIDRIFDFASPAQKCRMELMPAQDKAVASDICTYTFAAYAEFGDNVNAGVLVFSPNRAMHERLVRESLNTSNFDNGFMEQALLNYAYRLDGPFPASHIPHSYNGGADMWTTNQEVYVVHAKLWQMLGEKDTTWYKHTFNHTWLDMRDLYESAQFEKLRATGATPTDESYCCRDLTPGVV